MRFSIIIILVLSLVQSFAQGTDTLHINYINHAPFAFNEGTELKGIEIELLKRYASWLSTNKHMKVVLQYKQFDDYKSLYDQTRLKKRNSFGLAATIVTQQKDPDTEFSLPYIKNVAFCVTNANAMDIKQKSKEEISKVLGAMTAYSIPNTSLYKYTRDLKASYLPDLKIKLLNTEDDVLDELARNPLAFAYIDGISFWNFLRRHPSKSLKMQRVLSQNKEEIGFILPKGCPHNPMFKEFFNEFKVTPQYRALLEKYLGAYMTQNVAIN